MKVSKGLFAAIALVAMFGSAISGGKAVAGPSAPNSADKGIDHICDLIEQQADANGLPRDFFARLIWKESRFDANAVSPVGAEGIAQFMPGTAKLRGLADPFDLDQALPASAAYLAALRKDYGNLGLAAAAYNAGENRVSHWLLSGGFLPIETEDYVLDILGEPVDNFTDRSHHATVKPLDAKLSFEQSCRRLPIIMAATVPMAHINVKPWGIQVAGNFRRSAAVGHWMRVKARYPRLLAQYEPVVSRVRTPMGRRGVYAVRIGADSRSEANTICEALHKAGGSCVVLRNR
ncbi:MAG: lytic transglycosylase domain-containing protein [Rhizobiaceae bacterium]